MPSTSDRDARLYVEDMLEFCQRAREFAASQTLGALLADRMRYDAILRNLELIGEAATRVDPAHRALAPDIEWRKVVGTRNRLARAYLGIAPETIWSILIDDLPSLEVALHGLLDRIDQVFSRLPYETPAPRVRASCGT